MLHFWSPVLLLPNEEPLEYKEFLLNWGPGEESLSSCLCDGAIHLCSEEMILGGYKIISLDQLIWSN